jgi:hypothetical protein
VNLLLTGKGLLLEALHLVILGRFHLGGRFITAKTEDEHSVSGREVR